MLRKNDNLVNGLNKLCDGDKDGMFMDIYLLKGEAGKSYTFENPTQETAFLLIEGEVCFTNEEKVYTGKRDNCFYDSAYCLHVSKGKNVTVTCLSDAEILLQCKENETEFDNGWYDKSNIDYGFFGDGELKDTTKRVVTTILDKERTPWSNMVVGEIINFPGIWSSYPPHHHPQPEVYFYKFDKPQGFGSCFIGEDVYKSTHNSVALIPGGLVHPQNTAPGYAMYYVWMIPHLEGNPWLKTRIFDPQHEWVNGTNLNIFKLKED